MEQYKFSSLLPLAEFLAIINRDSLQFLKGKGREFVSTPVGTLFMSSAYTSEKPTYVAFGGPDLKTKPDATGKTVSLIGTFWLVNAVGPLTNGQLISVSV